MSDVYGLKASRRFLIVVPKVVRIAFYNWRLNTSVCTVTLQREGQLILALNLTWRLKQWNLRDKTAAWSILSGCRIRRPAWIDLASPLSGVGIDCIIQVQPRPSAFRLSVVPRPPVREDSLCPRWHDRF